MLIDHGSSTLLFILNRSVKLFFYTHAYNEYYGLVLCVFLDCSRSFCIVLFSTPRYDYTCTAVHVVLNLRNLFIDPCMMCTCIGCHSKS